MINENIPLSVRMRPQTLDEFVGQSHILGENCLLRRAIISKKIPSLIVWGPPGSGKTSVGLIISKEVDAEFQYLNAAFSSVGELKKIIKKAQEKLEKKKQKTILFIDEIHRFNKLQQEILVPDTETANVVLIGATIYNPYYQIIPSLISRSIVSEFKALAVEDIILILKMAVNNKDFGLGNINLKISDEALEHIALVSNGDARGALAALEIGVLSTNKNLKGEVIFDLEVAKQSIQKKNFYGRKDDGHYDTISAFIKSIRGSDADSSLYWLARMLKAGEDPKFIARRLVILASEDIGNANPFALILATSCFKAVEFIGIPEAEIILAQAVIYLSTSVKSNSAYLAINAAKKSLDEQSIKKVPDHLKTHSKNYRYPHDFDGYVKQDYGVSCQYYFPKNVGGEKRIKDFLNQIKGKAKISDS